MSDTFDDDYATSRDRAMREPLPPSAALPVKLPPAGVTVLRRDGLPPDGAQGTFLAWDDAGRPWLLRWELHGAYGIAAWAAMGWDGDMPSRKWMDAKLAYPGTPLTIAHSSMAPVDAEEPK